MRCPRCRTEVIGEGSCPRCGAPLRLADEPAPGPVDRPVDLDRRAGPVDTEPGPFGATPVAPRVAPPRRGPNVSSPQPRFTPPIWPEEPAPGPFSRRDVEVGEDRVEIALPGAPPLLRLGSWAVDGLLAFAFAWLLVAGGVRAEGLASPDGGALPWLLGLAALAHLAHATLGHALAGRTLGKWILGLVLVSRSGRRPGLATCAARGALALASAGLLGLGLLPALVGRGGRALHDLVLGTSVARLP